MNASAIASFGSRARLGQQVAAYGFPYSGILSSGGNFTLGNITSLSGIKDDTRFLQTSEPIQPGNSGGPLLDMSGKVIGVIVAQLDAMTMMVGGGNVPQNVNFAIQGPIVTNFLIAKGISPTVSSAATNLSPPEVADLARKFTVQISCQGVSEEKGARVANSINQSYVQLGEVKSPLTRIDKRRLVNPTSASAASAK
jgi:S1-C subfamily serine protease